MASTASSRGLTSPRLVDWRDLGACNGEDPDLFAPDGTTGHWALRTAQAKTICGRCPVREQCLEWALDTRQEYGIYGGLTEDERWTLRRRQARHARKPVQNPRGPKQPPPASMRELFDRHTSPTTGGHLLWSGAKTPIFQGRQLTRNQVAFIVGRGRDPKGPVHRACDMKGCVQPTHLVDN